MPLLFTLGWGKLTVHIYFNDHNHPHVHVRRSDEAEAIFDLDTLELTKSKGFHQKALTRIQQELAARHADLKEAWNEYQA